MQGPCLTGGGRLAKRADLELRESAELLGAVVESSYDTIAIFDKAGRFVYASPNHEAVFGWRAEDLIGVNCLDYVHPNERDSIGKAFFVASKRGTPAESTLRWRCRDGSYRWLEATGRAHSNADGDPRVVTIARDVTDRRLAQERLANAKRVEEIGLLAGGIAHDFNNLLTTILGNASLALEKLPEGEERQCIEEIEAAGRHASELAQQMLAYAGQSRFDRRPLDVSSLVAEVLDLLRSVISKRARLTLDLPDGLPPIEGDRSQIHQVAMNLLLNASDALGGAPGDIQVRTGSFEPDARYLKRCTIGDPAPAAYVYLEIADTGSGMTAETQSRIFEPYFTTKRSGRGLGLVAVAGVVHSHGGALSLQSEEGRGSRFRVLLPAATTRTATASESELDDDAWKGRGTVLLADDEPAVRRLAKRMLESLGFEVALAQDGGEALALHERDPDGFVLAMLDLSMPVMGGADVCRAIRESRPDLAVILASGYDLHESLADDAPVGRLAMLQKPYSLKTLRDAIRGLLEEAPGQTDRRQA